LNARLALVSTDPKFADELVEQMLDAGAATFGAIRDALENAPNLSLAPVSAALADETAAKGRRFRAYAAMVNLGGKQGTADLGSDHARAATWLLGSMNEISEWAALLRPVREKIGDELKTVVGVGSEHTEMERRAATLALAGLYADSPQQLVELLAILPSEAVPLLTNALRSQPDAELRALFDRIEMPEFLKGRAKFAPPAVLSDDEERIYTGYANQILAEVRLGMERRICDYLTRESDRTLRTLLTVSSADAGVSPGVLANLLLKESDPGVRQALLLMLCDHPVSELPLSMQEQMLSWLPSAYVSEPDGGVHSSIATLLKRWSLRSELEELDKNLPRTSKPEPGRGWWITPSGVDMRIVSLEKGRQVAISATEVTVSDFLKFHDVPKYQELEKEGRGSIPATGEGWVMASQYCNWISSQEGLPEEDWSYRDAKGVDQFIGLKGYRLPTALEIRSCVRPGGSGCWYLGSSARTLNSYAWSAENSDSRLRPVAGLFPDDLGLWDALGNAMEWSHELSTAVGTSSLLVGYSYHYNNGSFADPRGFRSGVDNRRPDAGFRLAWTISPK
jgi:hypothetical protein